MKKLLFISSFLFLSSCFRTQYTNFDPPKGTSYKVDYEPIGARKSGNQAFFVWGLAPGNRIINAQGLCGGTENIEAIQTKKTAGQVFLNLVVPDLIYTPRSGAVFCSSNPQNQESTRVGSGSMGYSNQKASITPNSEVDSSIEKLQALKDAKDQGLLTEKEYQKKRKEVVDSL